VFRTKWAFHYWNDLTLPKKLILRQHFWVAKTKTNLQPASNAGYSPILPPSSVRYLRPSHVHNLNHSYTKPNVACSISHSASNSSSEVHSKAVYWTVRNNCTFKEFLLAFKNFNFLKTHQRRCTPHASPLASVATGHNNISVIAQHSSPVPCKISEPVSPKRGCPVLPDLSDSTFP